MSIIIQLFSIQAINSIHYDYKYSYLSFYDVVLLVKMGGKIGPVVFSQLFVYRDV